MVCSFVLFRKRKMIAFASEIASLGFFEETGIIRE